MRGDELSAPTTVVHAFALLLVFQLIGEATVQGLGLPVPGPLLGMLLLFAGLCCAGACPMRCGMPRTRCCAT
jgi:putative effector of murein hydrolase LrgA (UPF0299 family)